MSNRGRIEVLYGVAIIVFGTAVLVGVLVFPTLFGWPVGFGLYRYRAEAWASIAQWMTAGIALAAAVFALNQVQEERRTRERQTPPNVVVFADINPDDWHWLDVKVKNFGQTAAYHVRLYFDPWPTVMPWIHPLTGDRVTRLVVPVRYRCSGQARSDGPFGIKARQERVQNSTAKSFSKRVG